MEDELYKIPEEPVYNPEIRKLQNGDPVRASDILNPVIEQMLENTEAVRLELEEGLSQAVNGQELNAHLENKDNPHEVTAAQTGAIPDSQKGVAGGVAELGTDGIVVPGQLPSLNYDPAGSAADVRKSLEDHVQNKDNPHIVTAAQTGAIPVSQKGAAGGVAELGSDGKVTPGQLPSLNYDPAGSAAAVEGKLKTHEEDKDNPHKVTAAQTGAIPVSQKGAAGGVAELGSDGKVTPGQLPSLNYDPAGSAAAVEGKLKTHEEDKNNPHEVTKAQLQLGNVNNTSDANKPISNATQAAIDTVSETAGNAYTKANSAYELASKNDLAELSPVIIGKGASGTDVTSTAVGTNVRALTNGTALGRDVNITGDRSVAIGTNATANIQAISIGVHSEAVANGATAVGYIVRVRGTCSTAVGHSSAASSSQATAMGYLASAAGSGSLSIGSFTSANYNQSVALGYLTSTSGGAGVGLGYMCNAADRGIAVGVNTKAASSGVALGDQAVTTGGSSIAIGGNASTSGNSSLSLGYYAKAGGYSSVAIGGSANCQGTNATAIGHYSNANGVNSTAIGIGAATWNDSGFAFGRDANVQANYSTAIGYSADIDVSNSIRLGSSVASRYTALYSVRNISATSDARDKTDVKPLENALDFLNSIQTVQYVDNFRSAYMPDTLTEDQDELKRKYSMHRDLYDASEYEKGTKKGERKRVGVMAQEIQEKMLEVYGTDNYAELVHDNLYDRRNEGEEFPDGVESMLAVNYTSFIPFLIKAVQELTEKNAELEERLNRVEEKKEVK